MSRFKCIHCFAVSQFQWQIVPQVNSAKTKSYITNSDESCFWPLKM